jgi:hypothetical protein
MTERVQAWQCIGCGKIEAPQTCIGVCQDRKVEFVYAFEHEETLAQLKLARGKAAALGALVRQLARTTPHEGEWERSYRALQNQARRALAAGAGDAPDLDGPAPMAES